MLRINGRNTNYNGQSIVNNLVLCSFSATSNDVNNNARFNLNIDNVTSVVENFETVIADFNAFVEEVLTAVSPVEEETEEEPVEDEEIEEGP